MQSLHDLITLRRYKDHEEKHLNMNTVRGYLTRNIKAISVLSLVSIVFIIHSSRSNDVGTTGEPRANFLIGNPYGMRGGGRAAIAVLSTNSNNDMKDLCFALQSLTNLQGGDKKLSTKAPLLVFNEGDLYAEQMQQIQECTDRPILFPIVQLNDSYPNNFDPDREFDISTKFGVLGGRDRWSYSQMIRFWTTTMWKHPAVQQFDTIMRIDTDSCFLTQTGQFKNDGYVDLPFLPSPWVYQSNYNGDVGNPNYPEYIQGLYDFAVAYMRKVGMKPSNPELWAIVQKTWEDTRNLPVFQTNFEVTRKVFFQRGDVVAWHESLTEYEPFGVFRHRWGDAQTRVLTAAMFGTKETIMLTRSHGYKHGRGRCEKLLGDAVKPNPFSTPPAPKKEETPPIAATTTTAVAAKEAPAQPQPTQPQPAQPQQQQAPPQESQLAAIPPPTTPVQSWPKGIAWLMTFPNSGTMFTTDLVTAVSETSTGTNYGNELRKQKGFNYMTDPGYMITPDGPFRYSTHRLPNGYLLTKTHCAGYCTECPPSAYFIDAERFARQCATGVKDKEGGGNLGVRYSFDIVKKAVHMFRNPFDNAVALFHNQYKVHERSGDTSWSYTYDRDGFWKWCHMMDSAFVAEEETMWAPEKLAAAKDVPCRAAFYQYSQWHNNAIQATAALDIPVLDLYYEDFHYDLDGQIKKLLNFLQLPSTGEPLPFHWSGGYPEYFTDEERARITAFLKVLCLPETFEKLKKYTDAVGSGDGSMTPAM